MTNILDKSLKADRDTAVELWDKIPADVQEYMRSNPGFASNIDDMDRYVVARAEHWTGAFTEEDGWREIVDWWGRIAEGNANQIGLRD